MARQDETETAVTPGMANAQNPQSAQYALAERHTVYQAQIVTHNSSSCIAACVASLMQQELPPTRIVILDNASQDSTADVLRHQVALLVAAHPASIDLSIHINQTNVGYAAGHNQCLRGALETFGLRESYVLTVNPDVVLAPDYAQRAIAHAQAIGSHGIRVGGVTGKLMRSDSSTESTNEPESPRYPVETPVPATVDSAGLRMGPFLHARDRGAGRDDEGQFETAQPVWGVCGAAALYNMAMMRELAEHGHVFDETFFIYKEDVDLCLRARLLGWSFHYEPSAVAQHDRGWKRHDTPSTAAAAHSFANQIAIVTKYLGPRRPFFWVCLLAESARWLLLTIRDPDAASLALRHIRENKRWNRGQRLAWQDVRDDSRQIPGGAP